VNRSRGWAVFVHGCFWHAHAGCRKATIPKTNPAFWVAKFHVNRARDRANLGALRELGYKVAVAWECELADPHLVRRLLREIGVRIRARS
jgi:DNA mismatch endonuclease, patch repair protein